MTTRAIMEILIMLAGSFGLGYFTCWLLGQENSTNKDNDDLKAIEGIGEKIESLLNQEGIYTYSDMIKVGAGRINRILEDAGPRFAMHDANGWISQAELAAAGDWEGLKKLQKKLTSGRI